MCRASSLSSSSCEQFLQFNFTGSFPITGQFILSTMSPPRREVMMNGVRPTPLKISKESNVIQKPSSSADHPKQQQQKRQGPIIIYTHSPKIIHTQARDFMTLVQRLTGLSRPDRELDENTAPVVLATRPRKNDKVNRQEDNETSSWITDENGGSYVPTTTTVSGMNPFFADMPLFTPSSTDFFSSPRPVHMFGDMGTLNSPTLLEFLKGLPDY